MHIYDFPDDPNEKTFTLEEMIKGGDTQKIIDWSMPRYSLLLNSKSNVKIKKQKIGKKWKITVETKPCDIIK